MWESFRNLLQKYRQKPQLDKEELKFYDDEDEEELSNNIVTLSFNITPENEVTINIDWVGETESNANNIGVLIRAVTTGRLDNTIIDILKEHGLENVDSQPFINRIISKWKVSTSEALVNPLKVFRASKFWEQ